MSPTRHAIILVAGGGKRLLPFTLTEPKCFAPVAGTRILENALRALAASGCERARIVVGHHAARVQEVITDRYAGVAIEYVVNPDYASTNSMYSLALGTAGWEGPSWVVEGDVFFDPSVLKLNSPAEIAWYVDSTTRGLDGAFVETDEQGVACSLNIVRDLSLLRPRQSKSVGVLHVSASGLARLRAWLQAGVAAGRQNDYYDLILRDQLHEGVVRTVDVAGRKWFEIDTNADLAAATELFAAGPATRMTSDYQTARDYWSHQAAGAPELLGVAALGGCGLTEVIYRHYEEVRHFAQLVPLSPTTSLLELGSGNGRWVVALAPRVGYYEAVDFSPQMLTVARDRVAAAGLANVRFVEAAAQDYAPERTFDVIYLSGVTQYLHDEDLTRMLKRLLPHLAPKGVIVDRSTVHRRERNLSAQPNYFSIYRTGDEIVRLFAAIGLVNRTRTASYPFLNFGRVLRRVLRSRSMHAVVTATAPVSFALLRGAARLRAACFAPTGELVDFSHEFFVFGRGATT